MLSPFATAAAKRELTKIESKRSTTIDAGKNTAHKLSNTQKQFQKEGVSADDEKVAALNY